MFSSINFKNLCLHHIFHSQIEPVTKLVLTWCCPQPYFGSSQTPEERGRSGATNALKSADTRWKARIRAEKHGNENNHNLINQSQKYDEIKKKLKTHKKTSMLYSNDIWHRTKIKIQRNQENKWKPIKTLFNYNALV